MNDCAWCGTGEGICEDCMKTMLAQSAQIASEGHHLAKKLYGNQDAGTRTATEIEQSATYAEWLGD